MDIPFESVDLDGPFCSVNEQLYALDCLQATELRSNGQLNLQADRERGVES